MLVKGGLDVVCRGHSQDLSPVTTGRPGFIGAAEGPLDRSAPLRTERRRAAWAVGLELAGTGASFALEGPRPCGPG